MAEIAVSSKNGGRRKMPLPRVDLTPMVDLGFLLISFFMFATTLAKPKTLELQMPYQPAPVDVGDPWPESSTITLIPIANHQVAYYNGVFNAEKTFLHTGFGVGHSLRKVLLQAQENSKNLPAHLAKSVYDLHVIIKPGAECTYKDVIAIIDELQIVDVKYYAMLRLSSDEEQQLKN